jgi:hypothetical protein
MIGLNGLVGFFIFFLLLFCNEIYVLNCNDEILYCIAAIPYVKNPQLDPEFRIFFSKEWYQALHLSVRNFFSEIFNATHILHNFILRKTNFHVQVCVFFFFFAFEL